MDAPRVAAIPRISAAIPCEPTANARKIQCKLNLTSQQLDRPYTFHPSRHVLKNSTLAVADTPTIATAGHIIGTGIIAFTFTKNDPIMKNKRTHWKVCSELLDLLK